MNNTEPSLESVAVVPPETPQLCATTLTRRYNVEDCKCDTYEGNLGPCLTWELGASGSCVYCDHSLACHHKAARQLERERDEARADSHAAFVEAKNEGKQMNLELKAKSDALVRFANANQVILSLLYDLNLLPEQLKEGSWRWGDMLNIIAHFEHALSALTTKLTTAEAERDGLKAWKDDHERILDVSNRHFREARNKVKHLLDDPDTGIDGICEAFLKQAAELELAARQPLPSAP